MLANFEHPKLDNFHINGSDELIARSSKGKEHGKVPGCCLSNLWHFNGLECHSFGTVHFACVAFFFFQTKICQDFT
jgi:hypothetical protein